MEDRFAHFPFGLPCSDIGKLLIVALCLAVRRLVFLAEMPSAGFVAVQCVARDQLADFEEVRHATRLFKVLVEGLP